MKAVKEEEEVRCGSRCCVLVGCVGWLGLAWGGDKKVAIPTHTKIIQVRTILVGGASAKIRVEWVSLFNWSISPSQSKVFC